MEEKLTGSFVERRLHACQILPPDWRLDSRGQYFELDLKMCQLKSLVYGFAWGQESGPLPRMSSVLESPSKIVRLDLSLNELTALEHMGLQPFYNLRELNASLNRINNFIGIEVLKKLYTLNLSHNFITKIDNLVPSESLVELNLSMNELTDISYMPSLINLEVLHISNNKLRSLEGVQALPRLRELYAQRNDVEDVVPLTSCFHLHILNMADNHITTLHNTVDILAQCRRLEVLSLHGNPIDRDPLYRNEILQSTNVMTLDNVSVRPLPRPTDSQGSELEPNYKHLQNISTLKEAARQAFEERMKDAKSHMEDQISFLQRRIVQIQNDHQQYETRLKTDLDSCLRYLDSLNYTEVGAVDKHAIRDSMGTPAPKPWQRSSDHDHDRHRDHRRNDRGLDQRLIKPDYSDVKRTEEVLRLARGELMKDIPR